MLQGPGVHKYGPSDGEVQSKSVGAETAQGTLMQFNSDTNETSQGCKRIGPSIDPRTTAGMASTQLVQCPSSLVIVPRTIPSMSGYADSNDPIAASGEQHQAQLEKRHERW